MLNVKSYKEAAYEVIKEKIVNGEYESGKSLNERTISEEFGISRTPVREALHKLSYEGWIINEPYKKNVVKKFDLETILEAQRVRASLEVLAVEESYKKFSDEDLKSLRELIEKQRKVENYGEFIILDRKFHEFIYKKSENSLLCNLMENINDIVRYFGLIAIESPGRTESTLQEHENIMTALEEKDIKKIIKATKVHMKNTEESIIKRYRIKNKQED